MKALFSWMRAAAARQVAQVSACARQRSSANAPDATASICASVRQTGESDDLACGNAHSE
jgi:hypothetical protein